MKKTLCSPLLLLFLILGFVLPPLLAKPKVFPKPQHVKWLKGEGAAGPITVITPDKLAGSPAQELYDQFKKKLPEKGLGTEGYLLEVSAARTIIVVAHTWGYLRAQETLKQLRDASGKYTYCRIADWPEEVWRGAHFLTAGAASQPLVKRLITEVLVPLKCNVIVYELDYYFQFKSSPKIAEIMGKDAWSKAQVREIADLCRKHGIILIPQVNCLGHQSWKGKTVHALLKAYPEFTEPPMVDTNSSEFYCHSWCPLHPQVNGVVFGLIDEMIDAFQSSYFHVGLDEVFVIASDKCPRCKGKDPAELFAKSINDLHGHITGKRRNRMLMWGDRLLNAARTGYSFYEASTNGLDDAIDMIPKDIIICDWHYTYRDDYPSLNIFKKKGFRVWPSVYDDLTAARGFQYNARSMKGDTILGTLTTVWCTADNIAYVLLGIKPPAGFKLAEKARLRAKTMQEVLKDAWNPD